MPLLGNSNEIPKVPQVNCHTQKVSLLIYAYHSLSHAKTLSVECLPAYPLSEAALELEEKSDMLLQRRHFLRLMASAIAAPALSRVAAAQAYPSRPVRLVVGFPAGGPVDIAARVIAPWLAERLGQSFVVDNQPGESGNSATRSVVRAAPDGYTLLICGPVNTINSTLFEGLDFNFERDIAPVASLWRVPLVIEVHPSVP